MADDLIDFSDCDTPEAVDARYRELFAILNCETVQENYWRLSDAQRRAHERFAEWNQKSSPALVLHDEDGLSVPVVTSGEEVKVGDVRAWAIKQGLKVGKRGRLHPDIIKAWQNR